MRKTASIALAVATAGCAGLAPFAARAAGSATVAYVSKLSGNDVAGCGLVTGPCKTFQYVHDNVVVAGGTIFVRDPGGYGGLAISKSISIVNDGGGVAGVFSGSGDAIIIQAQPTDVVLIKGLVLDGAGSGATGIRFMSGGSLTVTNCVIKGFRAGYGSGNGILITPSSGSAAFTISDTIVSGNLQTGITVAPSGSATVSGTITRVETSGNQLDGLFVTAGAASGAAQVFANQVNASNNGSWGFHSGGGSLYLTRSMATANGSGGVLAGGTVYTYGDNAINGNGVGGDVAPGPMSTARPLK